MSTSMAAERGPSVLDRYEPVIGLEVHVQLATRTKIFCSCPVSFGAPPNSNVCPVCLGLPGALPVLSRTAVEMAVKAALALHCTINPFSRFARKNYFYPDLPKGYQISQYDQPFSEHGHVEVSLGGVGKRIGITRVHMEDDAGKSMHEGFRDSDLYTYVDLNRTGTPLIEIVTDPDMRSSDEAHAFLTELKQVLQYVGVSECDMEKGQLRCDANISVRPLGAGQFGVKAEVKNLNSFRFAKMALDYEIERQARLIDSGGRVEQETRLYDPETGRTAGMRSKEHAHDYRYFPEPDLLPLLIGDEWLSRIRAELPELPAARRQRFMESHGLGEYDAQVLTASRELGDYFERAAAVSSDPKGTANWLMTDLMGVLGGADIAESPVTPEHLGELVSLIGKGEISGRMAKDIFAKMAASGESPRAIIDREGLRQISDADAIETIVDEVIAANPKQVAEYKAGKAAVLKFLVGQVMKASRGQANPAAVNEILAGKLK